MVSDNLLTRFLEVLRRYQRDGRFVGSAYGTELSTTEGFIIVELAREPSHSIVELAATLQLNKGTISRAVKALLEMGYLRATASKHDARRKVLSLSEKARRFLDIHASINAELIERCSARLTKAELAALISLLTRHADAEEAPAIENRGNEHPMTILMRRLARSHQVTGSSFMHSDYSSTEWQILAMLAYDLSALHATTISEIFSLRRNTLSQILNRFEERRWIERSRKETDKRSKSVEITATGRKALGSIESAAFKQLRRGLNGLNEAEQKQLVGLLEKYVGIGVESVESVTPEAYLKIVRQPAEIASARAFLLNEVFARGKQQEVGPVFCSPDNTILSLNFGKELSGVLELSSEHKGICVNFATAKQVQDSPLELSFLFSGLEWFMSEHRLNSIALVPESLTLISPQTLSRIGTQKLGKEKLLSLRDKLLALKKPLRIDSAN